ncbi:bifunctional DNA primase/polymerase [Leucobacter weissii]|uniref:Bifunctional DNA primase/polymerase n=1 Tax=Leucobacter weissii TaxID=1983706 RepID=A0A939SDA8_9MICO|nr:bifunctional DNA primase/polymerase [Leucobacter weissii]MBO1903250.1 bifunctional DNA primase/polymerase [Leucobacter weissii]
MGVGEVLASLTGRPLPEAASRLAAAGAPVFPCVPGGKRPLVEHGFHEATTDAGQVVAWWRRWPTANIGVPTGTVSSVDVVDVDQKPAGSGFPAFDRARGASLIPGWLALVRTPSGGMHAYFPADPQQPQPSWQASRARVDFRGEGGYVIVPPSRVAVPDGEPGRYELVGAACPDVAPVDAAALRAFLDPRPQPALSRGVRATRVQDAERLAGWVAALGEGERNRGLFWAACRLAESGASPGSVEDALGAAAEHAGLPPREVAATIRSAFRTAGAAAPRAGLNMARHDGSQRRSSQVPGPVLS